MAKIKTDLPLYVLTILALLAIPRVIVHDLQLLPFDAVTYQMLAVTPFAIWLLIAIFRKNKKPVIDFLILGLLFGLFLALAHQMLWGVSWGDNVPRLHGNLEGRLDPVVESLLLRGEAFISSLVTGVVAGGIIASIAYVAARVRKHLESERKK